MRDSGLRMVFLGAESGSDETLQRMNKGGTASAAKTLEIAAQDAALRHRAGDVVRAGQPARPRGGRRRHARFIRQVKEVNPATEIILYLYTPVPLAGELYDQAKAEGFAFPETLEEWIGDDVAGVRPAPERRDALDRRPAAQAHPRVRVGAQRPLSHVHGPRLTPLRRRVLRTAAAWRYRLGFYRSPIELRALQRLLPYRRPETSGF